LIENFRPGTLEKWGLAPETLLADNPGLIITRMSGYGQDGPYSQRPGFGLVGEAMGGWRYVNGDPSLPQSRMGISIGDSLCATYGCMGALAALEHRHKTGRGQIIDTSLYESVLQVMESLVIDYSVAGYVRERSGSILPGIAPSNAYQCSDGPFLIGGNGDSIFARLCEAMGMPELAEDDRYRTHIARGQRQKELDDIIETWTRERTIEEVDALMIKHGVPAGRMYRAPDMLSDPHFQARNSIVDVEHATLGTIKMQGVFPRLSETPGSIRRPAPTTPGADNVDVLSTVLNMSSEEIDRLTAAGTI
jgi:formyl-CoA transferase